MVKKTRPNLGIAIEGGADTKQKLPRVINIAAHGAAFEAGGLRVGQLILAVDGQKLDGGFNLIMSLSPSAFTSVSLSLSLCIRLFVELVEHLLTLQFQQLQSGREEVYRKIINH